MNHKQIATNRIFKTLDRIENKLGKMAHEISAIAPKLKAWQDGKLNGIYFLEFLNKFWDDLGEK